MTEEQLREKISQLESELSQAQSRERTLEDLLEKKLNEIYVHYHISRTISAIDDLQDMLQQVMTIIKNALPLNRISVYLLDESREKLELVYYSGLDLTQRIVLPFGEGTPGRVVENGEHVHIHDLALFYDTFNDFIHHPYENKQDGSYIGIALKVHNVTIGVIGMDNDKKYGLTVDDMDFMAILSHHVAAGIEKSILFEKIEHISQHDGLTGLYNHRMFQERLLQEVNRRSRSRKALSLMMLDIDRFKQFNDTYGHQAGDMVLKEIARIITAQTRCTSIDICCRYGGEEFAVIMPELELTHAAEVAERLRKAVESSTFLLRDGTRSTAVTASIGVACSDGDEEMLPEDLVKRADDALYRSKRNGRNKVSSE